ncbi:uncharacterized protein LOC142613496 [Castanea sativa]|uniref:uncharacterized protein LOC142613496 n=1 Tax=Castanea sativa TaxID=21020 RepID=UPI003F652CF0
MGSGFSAKLFEDTRYDAYCRQIKTINETDYVVNAVDTEVFSDIVQYEVLDKGIFGRADVQHMKRAISDQMQMINETIINAEYQKLRKMQRNKQIVDAIESVQLFASLFKVGNGCRGQSLECLKHDTGLNSNEVGCKRIYREDHMDLKRQLKFLNKLAKKTIQTKYGDAYDCINLYEQPFFNHYSLKSHIYDFPVRSASNPEGIRDQKSSPLFNPSNFWLNSKGCPVGMVPIRRNTMADLKRAKLATKIHNSKYKPLTVDKPGTHYAVVRTKYTNVYHGGSAIISIYNPKVEGTQYSSARIKVQNGPDSIEVGWTVNPTLYNDTRTRLYTFTKTASSSCFNSLCNSIIPTSTDIPLGYAIEPISTTKRQFDLKFMLFWKWKLVSKFGQDETVIRFWPKNVFTALGDGANYVEWGGEVFSPPGVPSPPMGSGYSAKLNEDTRYDAYYRQIKTINETDYVVNAVDTEWGQNKNNVYHGGSASISIYNPKVKGTQYSSARIKVQNYPDSIEVGWMVNPTLYNNTRTRLYTITKTAKSSCFDTLCNSLIPVRTDIPLDIPLESISTPEQQFDLQLMLFWDSSNGNWILKFGQDETVIGFWPKNVFTALGDGANYVEWGGEVFSPPGVPSPPMGSGYS